MASKTKNISVNPFRVSGSLQAPPSKSMMIRAIVAASLAEGTSILRNPSFCDDARAALNVAASLGAKTDIKPDQISIEGGLSPQEGILDCGESGLAIRLFVAVASLFDKEINLTGSATLRSRPLSMIEEPLRELGVEISSNKGFLPVKVKGPMHAGLTFVDGSQSSQFLTGLLMSLPLAEEDSEIVADHLKSTPYVDMTLKLMREFGVGAKHFDHRIFEVKGRQAYQPRDYYVEGDWSGVAFLLVAGALGGEVEVSGIDMFSAQADIQILEALELAGAGLERGEDAVKVSSAELKAFEMDITDCPDLAPPLACLAANCRGITRLKGAKRLLIKESNRAKTLQEEFEKLGIKIELKEDELWITGGNVKSGNVHSHGDHRIAMAGAVAAIKADGPVNIEHAECVSKSWPGFFDDLEKIGGIVNETSI